MLPFHAFANLFPLIEGTAFDELVADIAARGLREPILLLDGQILDGRNRYRASRAAGVITSDESIEPKDARHFVRFIPAADGDPLEFVISKNMHRRHLADGARAIIAAEIATLTRGRPGSGESIGTENPPIGGITTAQASAMMNVPERSVERAKVVRDHGAGELVQAVKRGDVSVSAAADLSSLSLPEQRRLIEGLDRRAVSAVVKSIRDEKTAEKKAKRAGREADLAVKQRALPEKRYGVIYADPEWRFEPYSRETGMDRAADNHYPTTPTNDIVLRPVGGIAAKDCVLFLWATAPMLLSAIRVLQNWGFEYKSHFIWGKDRIGNGYWNRNRHELLLIGTRGNIPAPALGEQWDSLLDAPVSEHSAKPDCFTEMIEAYFPNLPKIELNARRARPGWDAWGLEAPEARP